MDELADANVSGLIVPDKHRPGVWRVYFQGRLTAPRFDERVPALQYLGALKDGKTRPQFCRARDGKEIR